MIKRFLGTVIVTVIIIFVMWGVSFKTSNTASVKVETTTPTKKDIHNYINTVGKIKEGNKRNIYVNTPGKIAKIYVGVGERVVVGDTLIEIMPFSAEKAEREIVAAGKTEMAEFLADIGLETDFDMDDITIVKGEKGKIEIISPIDGIITDINVKKDDYITPVMKLISVSDFNNLYVSAKIPENYLYKISEKDKVKISADAFGNKSYSGKVEEISPVAKYIPSLTGNGETYIEAKISINKPSFLMRPGLTVNAKINSETREDALTVPYDCILQDERNREYLYVIKNDVAVKRYIITGEELESEVEIRSGVTVEDRIILNPTENELENKKVVVN